ncbi:Arm DNA-binding domain-containing protein [Qipengyuania flava]|uniref:Arm DNA-binding domain-containing protein n=1 Tax=Qipengyuania flava TaxID=192812 RepID=UPI001C581BDF|nr:Arm DNA-binding domain-containing protein [Qipengyuania flava]MBW3168178.1 Arm DNA-binding domain-containing protein [Qipengyuania flava]MBY5965416.1 Arm DNA-binding domain-containing protein [Qipengyuania flava]MBY6011740.1 Arm DNA-binding domain-containing protein [Qipengyuania flava]MBY6026182.1 Arm DNA-binding domain-containing protein [Qipengyuania flava]
MAIHKLKPLQVERAKKPGRYGDGGGLYLLVSPTLGKSWVLRIMCPSDEGADAAGKVLKVRRDIGLGGWPDCSLAEARELARRLRKVAKAGGDPIAARDKKEVVSPTFREAASLLMNEAETAALADLPEKFTIWRGCYQLNQRGLSWSLDRDLASRFPTLHRYRQDGQPLLIEAVLQREEVIALKLDRSEAEVVAWCPEVVRVSALG